MMARSNRANQDTIASMGGMRPLTEMLQPSRSDGTHNMPLTQANAALAIMHICRNHTENQTTVAEYGALGQLGTLMRHSNGAAGMVEAEAAGAVWSLAEGNDKNKVSIAGSGAIQTLCSLLGSTSERAQRHAASALASLSAGSVPNMEETTRILVGLLLTAAIEARGRVLLSLWRLVEDNNEHKVNIAKAGGAEQLVALVKDGIPAAKEYALWALSLAIDASYYPIVSERGGVVPLVAAVSSLETLRMEQAASALARLAAAGDEARALIARAGAIEPLVALLDGEAAHSSELAQQYAASALAELALRAENKLAIDRAGGISPLVALLCTPVYPPSDATEEEAAKMIECNSQGKRFAAAALARLAVDTSGEGGKQVVQHVAPEEPKLMKGGRRLGKAPTLSKAEAIADSGAIAPLVNLLDGQRGAEAQAEAAGALMALAAYVSNRNLITESGGIGPLVSLLGSDNPAAREHAEGALVRMSIEKANRKLIIEQLVEMLHHEDSAAQEQAAAALANLARDSTDNRVSIVEAGGIQPLLTLMQNSSKDKENGSSAARENTIGALVQLAWKSRSNQDAIAAAGGIPLLVDALLSSGSSNLDAGRGVAISQLAANALWKLCDVSATPLACRVLRPLVLAPSRPRALSS